MALDLHKIMHDGSLVHEEFTRLGWESGLTDPEIAHMWAHSPDECYDPVARFFADLRKKDWLLTADQHARADMDDCSWVGDRGTPTGRDVQDLGLLSIVNDKDPKVGELVAVVEAPPPDTLPIVWPPTTELQPWLLAEMAGICIDDAKNILAAPLKELPQVEREKKSNKHGQWSLFD